MLQWLRTNPDAYEARFTLDEGRLVEGEALLARALAMARRAGKESLIRELEAWLARLAPKPAGAR